VGENKFNLKTSIGLDSYQEWLEKDREIDHIQENAIINEKDVITETVEGPKKEEVEADPEQEANHTLFQPPQLKNHVIVIHIVNFAEVFNSNISW